MHLEGLLCEHVTFDGTISDACHFRRSRGSHSCILHIMYLIGLLRYYELS